MATVFLLIFLHATNGGSSMQWIPMPSMQKCLNAKHQVEYIITHPPYPADMTYAFCVDSDHSHSSPNN